MAKLNALHFAGSDFMVEAPDLSKALLADLKDCGAPGPADSAVAHVVATYSVTGDEDDCKAYLRGYGAWEDEELEDHATNLERLVWLSGASLREGEPAYFSTYG